MDRQDIDALLIGALYGELTPAEEAQLSAHLESHPADRQALDDLTAARTAVRDSRFLSTLLEPPQAVSALLLQEAARRAPRVVRRDESEREGWFARLRRSFIAHPAMATAAMMVLVVGVAGSMYLRNGGNKGFSEVSVSAERISAAEGAKANAAIAPATPAPVTAATTATFESSGNAAAGSGSAIGATEGYQAGVVDNLAGDQNYYKQGQPAIVAPPKPALARDQSVTLDGTTAMGPSAAPGQAQQAPGDRLRIATGDSANRYVVVKGEDPNVKEIQIDGDSTGQDHAPKDGKDKIAGPRGATVPRAISDDTSDAAETTATRGGAGGASGTGNTVGAAPVMHTAKPSHATAPPTAPPPPPPAAVAQKNDVAKNADKPAKASDDGRTEEQKKVDSLLAWAKEQHAQLIALVRTGKCPDAAAVALALSNRAPDYYAQYVATDRSVKQCLAYINDARDKDAERSGKARAKRISPVEAQPAPADVDQVK